MDVIEKRTNQICYGPATIAQSGDQEVLIYFITGNPGIIAYYDAFLSRLSAILNDSPSSERYYVCGSSLPGFELSQRESLGEKELPYGLDEQIESTESLIEEALLEHCELFDTTKRSPKVILMGHSIGCYILLEVLRRRTTEDCFLSSVNMGGGVLLFPTITYMDQSRNGRIASVSFDEDHQLTTKLLTSYF
jgi:pimeloyl-ACP methyl ester carboxylesterase